MPEFELGGKRPRVHPDAFVAPGAVLIGDVEVGPRASLWFGVVVRGDVAPITVGAGSNLQDNVVVHCARGLPTVIGEGVTIGHGACVEGCVIEDGAVVGTGAVMLQRSRLGARAMLAAGSVLAEGYEVPAGHLAAGAPAVVKKPLAGASERWVERTAAHYQHLADRYRTALRPVD
ncbi:MAG TPA: gamma carbonic anhydrase family protein [Candidatus Dormibacteraeota bacterium]|nr:gamma carbonic anhydrase family protein [Candidatus Dormibacteraeota bacterium]